MEKKLENHRMCHRGDNLFSIFWCPSCALCYKGIKHFNPETRYTEKEMEKYEKFFIAYKSLEEVNYLGKIQNKKGKWVWNLKNILKLRISILINH